VDLRSGYLVGRMPPEFPELEAFGFSFGCFGFFFSLRMSLFPMVVSLISGGWKRGENSAHPAACRMEHALS
jgi:hypothetical protein